MVAAMTKLPMDGNGAEGRVYDQIHKAIVERRLEPGTKLGEEALREIYGVSRAQIRSVLVTCPMPKSSSSGPIAAPMWHSLRFARPAMCSRRGGRSRRPSSNVPLAA